MWEEKEEQLHSPGTSAVWESAPPTLLPPENTKMGVSLREERWRGGGPAGVLTLGEGQEGGSWLLQPFTSLMVFSLRCTSSSM